MVRVPKLPLSITAVDSNTPSSISTTDMDVRMASLDQFDVLRRHSASTTAFDAATAIDRSCRRSYPAATTEDRAIERVGDATCGNGIRGSAMTAPRGPS